MIKNRPFQKSIFSSPPCNNQAIKIHVFYFFEELTVSQLRVFTPNTRSSSSSCYLAFPFPYPRASLRYRYNSEQRFKNGKCKLHVGALCQRLIPTVWHVSISGWFSIAKQERLLENKERCCVDLNCFSNYARFQILHKITLLNNLLWTTNNGITNITQNDPNMRRPVTVADFDKLGIHSTPTNQNNYWCLAMLLATRHTRNGSLVYRPDLHILLPFIVNIHHRTLNTTLYNTFEFQ